MRKLADQLKLAEQLLADIQQGRSPVECALGNVTAAIRRYFADHERQQSARTLHQKPLKRYSGVPPKVTEI